MTRSDLMPIGAFARRTGLTSSALRFYADSGLLAPAEVDPLTGYRSYDTAQVERARTLRRLREIAMPLAGVQAVLDAGAEEAARLLDEHLARIEEDAAAARRKAAVVRSALGGDPPGLLIATVKGPVLADAVEQVLTATAHEPGMAVLGGLHIEASAEAVALTATDRYRLSTRTLAPARPAEQTWSGTVDGDDLRAAAPEVRRSPLVRVEAVPQGIWLRLTGREDRHCRTLPGEFPDRRQLFASLGEVTTRATVAKEPLLRALEEHPGDHVTLRVSAHEVTVGPSADDHPGIPVAATVRGGPLEIRFGITTLYPALSTAIGPDVMLDLRGHDQPVTLRSADRGDLTTLAMPVALDHPA
ncbi:MULTISPECIES: DNA polymerase III subunit beta family protein [Streptomyces]|uniref:DNA polymerase III subunit beta family protein n=1 Tax=Streptomyces TaxID=1883 RepID=UPI0003C32CAF|nr:MULTISPECIES: MerR family transcriptional regulator [unclassified Streptomyces]ESQ01533.1 transcriptional regulator, MerR family protein [Streptomyces sp. GBA 94-10 4N24]ESQ07345.1 transcriptional regulator, MerR family protein [Streptomyces sp. PVA_94-07]UZN57582.1 transcriptional regulator, MerR family protein [Streptomyces sp. GBA 94-10 4N24]